VSDYSEFNNDLYEQTFEKTCHTVELRMKSDPEFTLEILKAMRDTEQLRLGNDWDGRGSLYHLTASATVAAYDHLIAEWEVNIQNGENA